MPYRALNRFLIALIKTIRPLLGPSGCCRYAFSCYDFGIVMLTEQPLYKAAWPVAKRVLSCNPLTFYLFKI